MSERAKTLLLFLGIVACMIIAGSLDMAVMR